MQLNESAYHKLASICDLIFAETTIINKKFAGTTA